MQVLAGLSVCWFKQVSVYFTVILAHRMIMDKTESVPSGNVNVVNNSRQFGNTTCKPAGL